MVIGLTKNVKQPFVDRKEYILTFKKAVKDIGQKDFNILVYYGIAGIGKTSLIEEFPNCLKNYNDRYNDQKVIWASVNLQSPNHREKNTFLIILKNELQRKSKEHFLEPKLHFPAFEIAHAIYWKKAYPEIPLRKENYLFFEGDDIFESFFGIVNQIPYFNVVPTIAKLVKNAPDYIRKLWTKIEEPELSELSEKKLPDIEGELIRFWVQDLNNYLKDNSKSVVLFIDTYEGLWENHRRDDYSIDDWIRNDLISQLSKKVLWVICSREALFWKEIESRWIKWNECLFQYKVKELPRKYCMKYLENRGITDKQIQEAIFEGSRGVPHYLKLSVDIYDRIIKNRKPEPEDFGYSHQEITDKFFRFFSQMETDALKVLSFCRFWDYDLFRYLIKEFSIGYSTNNYEDLCRFSFIGKAENEKKQMHQLMQECLQKTQEQKNPYSVKRIHEAITEYYTNKLKDIDIKAITQEHETYLIEAVYHAKNSSEKKDLLRWFVDVSHPFYRAAFWQLITPMYEEIHQILEIKLGSEHPDVAAALNNLAVVYREMGDYEKTLPHLQRALYIRENVLGSEHADVAETLNNLALFYESMGAYEKVLPLLQRALAINEKVLGSEHPDVATTLNNLALFYDHIGDYEKALPLYQRALEIKETVLGTQHPDIANSLSNLASLYANMGDYEKVLPLYQRALDIRENVLGSEHADVAITLNNLALFYNHVEDYEKALPLYQRALKINEKALGMQHPSVATILNNLAILYENIEAYEKALPLFQRALYIRENVLGSEHADVANSLNNLAILYDHIGDYEKALPLLQKARAINEKALGTQHPSVATTLNNLALFYDHIGDYEKALPLYQRALEIKETVLGSEHTSVATTLNNLAGLYFHIGAYEKALPIFQKTLDIQEKALGSGHPVVATTLKNFARLYRQMGSSEKAVLLYQRAIDIHEKVLGPQHLDVAQILNNLARFYVNVKNYEEALTLLEHSLEIYESKFGPNYPDFKKAEQIIQTLNNECIAKNK